MPNADQPVQNVCTRSGLKARIVQALLIAGICLLAARACPAAAQGDLPQICENAAIQAAKATGVPLSVLRAISLTETGRKDQGSFRPWPWTVNMEGKGMWFDTRDEALAYAFDNFQRGARSFDVGCFQLNYKWHHKAFTSIDQMFDPLANALYAAEFLKSLFQEKGNWGQAAGAYHSRNAKYADGYQARFEKIRARFAAQDGDPLPEVADSLLAAATAGVDPAVREEVIRINTYPLLQGEPGQGGLLGSLMPQNAAAGLGLSSSAQRGLSLIALPGGNPAPDPGQSQIEVIASGDPETTGFPQAPAPAAHVNLGAIY